MKSRSGRCSAAVLGVLSRQIEREKKDSLHLDLHVDCDLVVLISFYLKYVYCACRTSNYH